MPPILVSRIKMGLHPVVIVCAILLLILPLCQAQSQGQNFIQYQVQINADSSATWTITVVSDINATVDTFDGFQQRIATLVSASADSTGRGMAIDPTSPQLENTIETQHKISKYSFIWENFSIVQDGKITFGDVFQVTNLFSQLLYGDGNLQFTYSSTYTAKSVVPSPDRMDNNQTLEWYRTQDFINGKPHIVLASISSNVSSGSNLPLPFLVAIVLAVVIAISLIVFYVVRQRKVKGKVVTPISAPSTMTGIESDEDKILKLIQSSGGSLNQSIIAEKCRFSKAKTSQLLSALEKKGVVRRYKSGRDKIVTFDDSHRQ